MARPVRRIPFGAQIDHLPHIEHARVLWGRMTFCAVNVIHRASRTSFGSLKKM
jgi:hypothetical protein